MLISLEITSRSFRTVNSYSMEWSLIHRVLKRNSSPTNYVIYFLHGGISLHMMKISMMKRLYPVSILIALSPAVLPLFSLVIVISLSFMFLAAWRWRIYYLLLCQQFFWHLLWVIYSAKCDLNQRIRQIHAA